MAYNVKNFDNLKLQDSDEVLGIVEEYLKNNIKVSIIGLANALCISKKTLMDYVELRAKDIPTTNVLEEHIAEVEEHLGENIKLSFVDRTPTKSYLRELKEALALREIANILSYACAKIEEFNTDTLYESSAHRGGVFVLKNSFGYSDKQEVEVKAIKKFEDLLNEIE